MLDESQVYTFTEADPGANHRTVLPAARLAERVQRKYHPSPGDAKPVCKAARWYTKRALGVTQREF
jgi:hypothetical protein